MKKIIEEITEVERELGNKLVSVEVLSRENNWEKKLSLKENKIRQSKRMC